jgi:hypothetical protein
MNIYDGFMINDELDILELRLTELWDVVDVFVIVESPFTFTQKPKPMYFRENFKRFEKWESKIRAISPPNDKYLWAEYPFNNFWQRGLIAFGFEDAMVGDFLMVSDIDEIPNPKFLRVLKDGPLTIAEPVALVQKILTYSADLYTGMDGTGTVICPAVNGGHVDCQLLRDRRKFFPRIPNGGWHLGWFGDAESMRKKLYAMDVAGDAKFYNCPETVPPKDEEVDSIIASGVGLFDRKPLQRIPIEPGVLQPNCIVEWLRKYPKYARAAV